MIALFPSAVLLAWASAHRPDHALVVERSRDIATVSAKVCHGCLWHAGCDPDTSRIECDGRGGIWHVEDPDTELVEGELGEFGNLHALDLDGDGEVSMEDLTAVLTALGETPSAQAVQRLKEQIDNDMNSSHLSLFSSSSVALAQKKEKKFFFTILAVITVVVEAVQFVDYMAKGGNFVTWAKDYVIDYVTDPCNYLPSGKIVRKVQKMIDVADNLCTAAGLYLKGAAGGDAKKCNDWERKYLPICGLGCWGDKAQCREKHEGACHVVDHSRHWEAGCLSVRTESFGNKCLCGGMDWHECIPVWNACSPSGSTWRRAWMSHELQGSERLFREGGGRP